MNKKVKNTKTNFDFLVSHDAQLVLLGILAEKFFSDDPSTSLIKLRQFAEVLAKLTAARLGILQDPAISQHDLLGYLSGNSVVTREVLTLFHEIRKTGNKATHDMEGDYRSALHHMKLARELGVWFHRTFEAPDFKPGPFQPPQKPKLENDYLNEQISELQKKLEASLDANEKSQIAAEAARRSQLAAEELAREVAEEKIFWEAYARDTEASHAETTQKLIEIQSAASNLSRSERADIATRSKQATESIDLDEAATRKIIDRQLEEAGWIVDSANLTYSKGARPEKNKFMAIAEWPTASGPADYVLFDGLTAIAAVEAKRKNMDVAGALTQSKRYSEDFLTKDVCDVSGGPWGNYKIPFVFSSNGRPFLEQLRTQSGIWFCDVRRAENLSHPMDGWYSPEGLKELLKQDIEAAEQDLNEMGYEFDFKLRPYQQYAIEAAENAIKQSKRHALLAMATGTGKTKTCIAMIYRLLKAQRFRRILFLVDRTALGEQAADSFKDTRMESLQTFADIFGIKELGEAMPETATKVHISTVQGMVRRLLFTEDSVARPTVDQYDCIVVDECHRGYLLDRELSETELTFRDQGDYVSKYRRVLDYFDAVKIGLTATPALHTTEIFGEPVYTYSYREAVLDGYLIDHELPYNIVTELSQSGIEWQGGEDVQVYNTGTQEIETHTTPDELQFEVSDFNKKVITSSFNEVICDQLAQFIDPNLPGKTLIFCATDKHADMVVDLLKQAFNKHLGSVEDDAVVKITGTSDKPLKLIRRYKNEKLPNVAVTVDLMTTGIDVPEITNLVFIRRVNSRILYEQMMGRATRRCDEIGKEVFHIFDAVGLYDGLKDVSTMKPVVQQPNITYQKLIQEISGESDPKVQELARDQMVAKFQRKMKRIKGERLDQFEAQAEMTPADFLEFMKTTPVNEVASWFVEHGGLAELLDRKTSGGFSYLFISEHEDEVREITRGFGNDQKPEDYLISFSEFINKNADRLPALKTVLTRPGELTRAELKNLILELERYDFNERQLDAAWHQTTNEAIAGRIIGHILQAAKGSPLIPYDYRVDEAVKQLKEKHQFTPVQLQWLDKIANQMKANQIVDRETLDQGFFRDAGGFRRLDKVFDGQLEGLIKELNETAIRAEA